MWEKESKVRCERRKASHILWNKSQANSSPLSLGFAFLKFFWFFSRDTNFVFVVPSSVLLPAFSIYFFEALSSCELVFPSLFWYRKAGKGTVLCNSFPPWEISSKRFGFIMRVLEGIIVVSLPLFLRVMRLFFSDFPWESLVQPLEGIGPSKVSYSSPH